MNALDELASLLKPAGAGLYLVSSGRAAQLALQRRLYGVETEAQLERAFCDTLERIASARVIVLGIPSDVGAGFLRGSNQGPQAIREGLLRSESDWPGFCQQNAVVDIGDVFVVPQLLHDDMLSEEQKQASRSALYGNTPGATRLPVSPLSIAERAWDLVYQLNPRAKPLVLGGDHSCAWPTVAALHRARPGFGIVQPDAHTDLLETRLGVKYCFATWSYHANDLIGRAGRLVQVGTRASRYDRGHWESTLGVRQFWAEECRRNPAAALDELIAHVKASGVETVYFSNDIDGTCEAFGDATGTPEPDGLTPDFVVELIRRLGREIGLSGGDLMELAPALGRTPEGRDRTVALAVCYVRETILALLAQSPSCLSTFGGSENKS